MVEMEMLHQCSIHFLSAPLESQLRAVEQMPNGEPKEVRDGRMSMDALDVTLGNAELEYCDLNDREKYWPLKRAGLWAIPKMRRGPEKGFRDGSVNQQCGDHSSSGCVDSGASAVVRSGEADEAHGIRESIRGIAWEQVQSGKTSKNASQHVL